MGLKKVRLLGYKSIFLQMGSLRFQRDILNLNYFSICCHIFFKNILKLLSGGKALTPCIPCTPIKVLVNGSENEPH